MNILCCYCRGCDWRMSNEHASGQARFQRMLGEMSAAEPTEKADKREHGRRKNPSFLARSRTSHVPATVLAEASGPLRERDYHSLRNYGGGSASNAAKRQEKGGEYAIWLQYAACGMRCITGRARARKRMRQRRSIMRRCAKPAIVMGGRHGESQTDAAGGAVGSRC